MSETTGLERALLDGTPYFGPALAATQGPLVRKAYMRTIVEFLVRERPTGAIEVLEVGAWAGASTVTWALAIKEFAQSGQVTCIDLWKPYFDLSVDHLEVYDVMQRAAETNEIYRLFVHNIRTAGVEPIVKHIVGDSREVIPRLVGQHFDVVFIDGAHVYDIVSSDIANAKRLVRDGGILCGDDLELTLTQPLGALLDRSILGSSN
jgi:predicted O-methyltransferase YrrM